jgi:serine/threonine-protein kinase
MLPERDQYESLLESVADGSPVDWAALDAAAATAAEKKRYRNLRLVARVAELHRTLVLEEDDRIVTSLGADAASADPETWGHLSIASRLASGAFGQIYRAHDSQLNRSVALKLLRRDLALVRPVDRLLDEARTLAQVDHPNVVTVHGADVRDGRAGLWMELVDGQTLEAWLAAHGPMGAREVASIGMDLCGALAAVHRKGLVHGDVKAQNVMREKGGRIVLMDFGAGRAQGVDAAGVAGTPMYLAPEVLAGAPPTPQSDLYSLGVLLFHLLTNSFPYSVGDIDTLRAAHADGSRTWLRDLRPDLPHAVVESIERAIDPDPARRFATAGAMERALHLDTVPVIVRPRWFRSAFAIPALSLLAVIVAVIVWSGVLSPAPVGIKTVAILPMTDFSSQPSLADGLHDQLITTLGQIQSLRVTSRTSVLRFKNSSLPAGEVAKKLGVDAVLESSVSFMGGGSPSDPGHVHVNASLLMAGSTVPEWSKTFDRSFSDLEALQGELARAIASTVHARVTRDESVRLNRSQQIDPAAQQAYFEGLRQLDLRENTSATRALKAFQRAAELDSRYALAHVGSARSYLMIGSRGDMSHAEARASALAEVRDALTIDENLPEAHAAQAEIKFYYDWDWPGAEAEYRRALELNPSLTYARRRYAAFLAAVGRLDEAVEQASQAELLDSFSTDALVEHGMVLYYRRDFEAARAVLARALSLEQTSKTALFMLARVDEAEGHFDDALQRTNEVLRLAGGGILSWRLHAIRLQALAGHEAEAQRAFQELRRTAAENKQRIAAEHLAYLQIAFGNLDEGMALLEDAASELDPDLHWLAVDPRVDRLRPMPRFTALLERLRLPNTHGPLP